ncbi:MAG TPA: hypothetical protein VIY69_13395 [Candidatus Acidoferrales bacterium]
MKIAVAVAAAMLISGSAFAQQAPAVQWQCHTLASSGNYVGPDEQIVNGMACKAVTPTAASAPAAPVAPEVKSQPQSAIAPAPQQASASSPGAASAGAANGSESHSMPYVYIEGTGNTSTRGTFFGGHHFATGEVTTDERNQTIELAQDFSKECHDVRTTLNQDDADYTVNLNHQAFHGLAHKNDQIMVSDRSGAVVSAGSDHSVTGAVKDACKAIVSDFASKR